MKKALSNVALLALAMLASNGCLIGGHSNVKREGTRISDETLKQIEIGKTDKNWIFAVMGEPTERKELSDNETIWKYAYKETKDSGGYVFLVFGGHSTTESEGRFIIQFKDNVVTRYWRN